MIHHTVDISRPKITPPGSSLELCRHSQGTLFCPQLAVHLPHSQGLQLACPPYYHTLLVPPTAIVPEVVIEVTFQSERARGWR
jgi:hypothetical protein